jgi:hypothetical protein
VQADRAFSYRRCEVLMVVTEIVNQMREQISRTIGNGGKRSGNRGACADTD